MDIANFITSTSWFAIVSTDNAAVTTDGEYPPRYRLVYHTPSGWRETSFKNEWFYHSRNDGKILALCIANGASNIQALREIISNFRASLISHPQANQPPS